MVMAVSVAGVATEASAQSKKAKASKRDSAISQCVLAAQKLYPSDTGEQMTARTAAYKACMRKAGYRG
jgi:hypothetical protein